MHYLHLLQIDVRPLKQNIYQRSDIMVVLVCIIFILSEAINATLAFFKHLDDLGISIHGDNLLLFSLRRFKMIILEVGFGLKYLVYLIMSENFRHAFKNIFCKNSTRSKRAYKYQTFGVRGGMHVFASFFFFFFFLFQLKICIEL